MFALGIQKPTESKMIIDATALQNLFLALSNKKLEKLWLSLCPTIDETTSGAELE